MRGPVEAESWRGEGGVARYLFSELVQSCRHREMGWTRNLGEGHGEWSIGVMLPGRTICLICLEFVSRDAFFRLSVRVWGVTGGLGFGSTVLQVGI
jgi:hypothetical protein